jgi:hypothetical protein
LPTHISDGDWKKLDENSIPVGSALLTQTPSGNLVHACIETVDASDATKVQNSVNVSLCSSLHLCKLKTAKLKTAKKVVLCFSGAAGPLAVAQKAKVTVEQLAQVFAGALDTGYKKAAEIFDEITIVRPAPMCF